MANEDQQTILWQTNHLEMPPASCSYHLVTNNHSRRETGTDHGHLGPRPRDGHSSLTVMEGELSVVERKRKLKPLLWVYHPS